MLDLDALEKLDEQYVSEFISGVYPNGKPTLIELRRAIKPLIAELRALRAANRWRPIAEADPDVSLDIIAFRHPFNPRAWLRSYRRLKKSAIGDGYTHFFMLPDPPEVPDA